MDSKYKYGYLEETDIGKERRNKMERLNEAFLNKRIYEGGIKTPKEGWNELPEKVLQFGTGVLLRGLPDYLIEKANQQGTFNGRIVVVKSMSGGVDEFIDQDNLYTLHSRGIENSKIIKESIVISSISRVLIASSHWEEIISAALQESLRIVISNTTEVGIVLDESDDLNAKPPVSFPGKLTVLLYKRFLHFKGVKTKGLVILPTELINDNGLKLKSIVLELSKINKLGEDFIGWLDGANFFCNTLVDRIVPGKLILTDKKAAEDELGYIDDLAIMAEPFKLWAIESDHADVINDLSFIKADEGVIITSDIGKFKELKLRLLNGTHTFSCALAILSGFSTVKEAMANNDFLYYIESLLKKEIVPAVVGDDISEGEALDFAGKVIDRFRNPFLNHKWQSISLNYTNKMQTRNIALIERYVNKAEAIPEYMALGFAGYLHFLKDGVKGDQDPCGPLIFNLWMESREDIGEFVEKVLENEDLWGKDLSLISGFAEAVKKYLQLLLDHKSLDVIRKLNEKRVTGDAK